MKKIGVILFASFLITACSDYPENYQPLPKGFDYLQNTDALSDAVESHNKSYVREHAWNLWAGIMQPAKDTDWPVWYTWQNTYGAFTTGVEMSQVKLLLKGHSLIKRNSMNLKGIILDTLQKSLPYYPIPTNVIDEYKNTGAFQNTEYTSINVGKHFMFNGDIMVPTESLSKEAFDWIRNDNLNKKSKLDSLYKRKQKNLEAPKEYIVTKHMYWPVLKEGISALPVWNDDYYNDDFRGYAGYETWTDLVGIDPSGDFVGTSTKISYLYGVKQDSIHQNIPLKTITANAKVYSLDSFYHHQITSEDWESFDEADKAILNASSYWAHNKAFGIGDYLITIAMHINTKEIPSWALQSVWWSNKPNLGQYHEDRPSLPAAKGPWDNYLLVDSYGIIDPNTKELPIAMNPYIELVIHPIATNCNNCHSRAGYPKSSKYFPNLASYQNRGCQNLLEKFSRNDSCFSAYLLTDFQWLIPDHAK